MKVKYGNQKNTDWNRKLVLFEVLAGMYHICTLSGSYGGAKISRKAVGPGLKEKKNCKNVNYTFSYSQPRKMQG